MGRDRKKGLKPLLLRYLAFVMGICYLANPLQHQLSTVFHEASHVFSMPNTVITHTNNKTSEIHQYSEHDYTPETHQHRIVDILNSIFEAAGENDEPSEDSLIFEIKFDKHLSKKNYTLKGKIRSKNRSRPLLHNVEKINTGHGNVLEEPPQNRFV